MKDNERIKRLEKYLILLEENQKKVNLYVVTCGIEECYFFKTETDAMEYVLKMTYTPYSGWRNIKEAYSVCYVDTEKFFKDDYIISEIHKEIIFIKTEITEEKYYT